MRLSWLHRARRRMVVKTERAEIVFTVSFQTPPLISFAQVFVKSDRLLLVIHVRRILLVYPSWLMISGGGFSRSKAEREKGSVVRQVLWRKSSFSISCRFERQSFFFLIQVFDDSPHVLDATNFHPRHLLPRKPLLLFHCSIA